MLRLDSSPRRLSGRRAQGALAALALAALFLGCGGTVDGAPAPGGAGGSGIALPTGERCDDLCDGTVDGCFTYSYDAVGNVLKRMFDNECDGIPDECDSYTYDSANRILAIDSGACGGGKYDCESISYASDGSGTEQGDVGCDGTIDNCVALTFDGRGLLIAANMDNDCDGTLEFCTSYDYDEDGRPVDQQTDQNCDGVSDICDHWVYENDATDVLSRVTKSTCSGTPVSCCTYTYD